MTYSGLLKYALFDGERILAQIVLDHVSDTDVEDIVRPGLWRAILHGGFRDAGSLEPVALQRWYVHVGAPKDSTVEFQLIVSEKQWPIKENRLQQRRIHLTLERLQRELFHEEQELFGEFVNRRAMEARKR